MTIPRRLLILAALISTLSLPASAENQTYSLRIKNHLFEPAQLKVPANTALTLKVTNEDNSAEEFESHDLKREKVIAAGKTASIKIGPLKPGEYKFFGEFHEETAQGVLIAE